MTFKRIGPNLTREQAVAQELSYETKPMRIGASIPVMLIRREYELHGQLKAISIGHQCFDEGTITDAQILAIAREEATLRGYSDVGITYHTEPCKTCRGKGRLYRIVDGRTSSAYDRCPTCEGDGFDPPLDEMPHRVERVKPPTPNPER